MYLCVHGRDQNHLCDHDRDDDLLFLCGLKEMKLPFYNLVKALVE